MELNNSFSEAKKRFSCGMKASVFFDSISSIQAFANDVRLDVGLDGISEECTNQRFDVEIRGVSRSLISSKCTVSELLAQLPLTVILDNEETAKAFSAACLDILSSGEVPVKNDSTENNAYATPRVDDKTYATNHGAEDILERASTVFRTIFTVIGIILIIAGFVFFVSGGGGSIAVGIGALVGGICVLALGYVVWAAMIVVVNISNNLYNIRDSLKNK